MCESSGKDMAVGRTRLSNRLVNVKEEQGEEKRLYSFLLPAARPGIQRLVIVANTLSSPRRSNRNTGCPGVALCSARCTWLTLETGC